MKSFFEIAGHLVDGSTAAASTSLPSSKFGGIAAERPERGRNSAKAEEATTRADLSLFEHWKKTSFHVVRGLGELDRRQQIYFIKNPYHFAVWGIGKIVEVIDMHDQYLSDFVDSKTDRFS